jgi:hypothetical protein
MRLYRCALLIVALWFAVGAKPGFAAWDDYDDSQSHPLRILAYLAHPAAFLLEWTVFRPFHFLVSATEAQEAVFGHTPHPQVLSDPQPPREVAKPKQVSMTPPPGDVLPAAYQAAEPAGAAEIP